MKRSICTLVTAAALAGCSSPVHRMSTHGHVNPGYGQAGSTAPVVAQHQAPFHRSANGAVMPTSKDDPTIQLAGYNHPGMGYNAGHGSMQNRSFGHQKVGRAVPSHGGYLPGTPNPIFGSTPGMPGPGMGGPGMGGMPGPGGPGGMPGMGGMPSGPGCPPGMGGMPGGGMPGMGGMPLGPRFATGRTQVRFVGPAGTKIGWQSMDPTTAGGFTPPQLEAPARYNFAQARIYRLKLTDIPQREGLELYPTLEVYPGNMKVDAYLSHNAVPIDFTDEDFDQVRAGNFVTKVIYLPDPKYQELAIAGVETLVSTRLDPGIDPVREAHKRGTILLVIRLGSVDLEMSHSPSLFPSLEGRLPPAPPAPQAPQDGSTTSLPEFYEEGEVLEVQQSPVRVAMPLN